MFEPNDLRPTVFGCPSHQFHSTTGKQKGITQTIYTDSLEHVEGEVSYSSNSDLGHQDVCTFTYSYPTSCMYIIHLHAHTVSIHLLYTSNIPYCDLPNPPFSTTIRLTSHAIVGKSFTKLIKEDEEDTFGIFCLSCGCFLENNKCACSDNVQLFYNPLF